VNLLGLTVALAASFLAPGDDQDSPVSLRVVAVQALTEETGRRTTQFDPGITEIADAVKQLPFNTYHKIKMTTVTAPLRKETQIPINPTYCLYVTPMSRDSSGRIQLNIRVTMKLPAPRAKPLNALTTTLWAVPSKKLTLGGLKLDKGELVLVLAARG